MQSIRIMRKQGQTRNGRRYQANIVLNCTYNGHRKLDFSQFQYSIATQTITTNYSKNAESEFLLNMFVFHGELTIHIIDTAIQVEDNAHNEEDPNLLFQSS